MKKKGFDTNENKTPFYYVRMWLQEKENQKITQQDISDRLKPYGVTLSQQEVNYWETGYYKKLSPDVVKAYNAAFGVSADFLLGITKNIPDASLSADVVSCSQYLGLSVEAVENIKRFTNITDTNGARAVFSEQFKKNSPPISKFIEWDAKDGSGRYMYQCSFDELLWSGFVAEYVLTQLHDCGFFYYIFEAIRTHCKYSDNKELYDFFVIHVYAAIENIATTIRNCEINDIKQMAINYDARNGSDIYADLFGSDSE